MKSQYGNVKANIQIKYIKEELQGGDAAWLGNDVSRIYVLLVSDVSYTNKMH